MITKLVVENIKAFRNRQSINLKKLNLIYGQNSGGKTTLIQSLLLLKQTILRAESLSDDLAPLIPRGEFVDLGNYRSLITDHLLTNSLAIGLAYNYDYNSAIRTFYDKDDTLGELARYVEFGYGWDRRRKLALQKTVRISIGEAIDCRFEKEFIRLKARRADTVRFSAASTDSAFVVREQQSLHSLYDFLNRPHRTDDRAGLSSGWRPTIKNKGERDTFKFDSEAVSAFPIPLAIVRPSDREQYDDNMHMRRRFRPIALQRTEIRRILESITHLGPLRQSPERVGLFTGSGRKTVGAEGEFALEFLAQAPKLTREVNTWLEKLKVPYSIVATIHNDPSAGDLLRISLRDKRSKLKVGLADVGFGISQVLPIVVEALLLRDSVICIEQPEIHLHPALQTELADLLIQSIGPDLGNQLLVETHSQELLMRIQQRVRKGTLDPADVAVLYVDQNDAGTASVREIPLGRKGELLEEFPSGFIDLGIRELFGTSG